MGSQIESVGRLMAVVFSDGPPTESFVTTGSTSLLKIGTPVTGTYASVNYYGLDTHYNPRVQFKAYARKVVLKIAALTAVAKVYVDSVLTNTIAINAAWQTVTLIDLPSDGWHEFEIYSSGFPVTQIYFDEDEFLTLTSARAAVAWPTLYSNPLQLPSATGMQMDNSTTLDASGGYKPTHVLGSWTRFKATTNNIKVFCLLNGSRLGLFSDGSYVRDAECAVPADGFRYGWVDLGSTDGAAEHEYIIIDNHGGTDIAELSKPQSYTSRISVNGFNTNALSARAKWVWSGDSITWGYGAAHSCRGYSAICAITKGVGHLNIAIPGHKITDDAATIPTTIDAIDPVVVVFNYGQNDVTASTSEAAFKQALYSLLHNTLLIPSVTKIYYPGIFPRNDGSAAAVATYNGYIQAIIAGGDDGLGNTLTAPEQAKIEYISMAGVVTNWFDNLHPDNLGHSQAATAILAALD